MCTCARPFWITMGSTWIIRVIVVSLVSMMVFFEKKGVYPALDAIPFTRFRLFSFCVYWDTGSWHTR